MPTPQRKRVTDAVPAVPKEVGSSLSISPSWSLEESLHLELVKELNKPKELPKPPLFLFFWRSGEL
jgi:hypothetical protein